MSESVFPVGVAGWVERVRPDPIAYQQRQTMEIALNAIAMTKPLQATMFLKGGILMGLAHGSPRQTADIDLTTVLAPARRSETISDGVWTQCSRALWPNSGMPISSFGPTR